MEEQSLRQALADMPVFKDMNASQLETLASRFRVQRLEPGELLYREGGSWDYIGIILEGSVNAKVRNEDNRQVVMGQTHSRSAVGLFNLRRAQRAPATMKAATQVRLAVLPVADMEELKREMPALMLLFYEGMLLHITEISRRMAAYISDYCPPPAP
ncbi:Crp/Fnr family transcriptional regulator [Salidesulfovibrio onnuriiensis]|uniref:Crp/Fnr family transcriptional regulator n=1 Tax=Salidesulfovibrio onnuriiensis TaxID=2583823 RepID=UPI00164F1F10|nr:cyclic nucleotide-binding domain-containing protein [Salidesulfovibrio onnuriiensis]